jgi:hypothetical protein
MSACCDCSQVCCRHSSGQEGLLPPGQGPVVVITAAEHLLNPLSRRQRALVGMLMRLWLLGCFAGWMHTQ